jgi:hypothetical protein
MSTQPAPQFSSAIGEFAKKRRLADRGIFLEKGAVTTSAGVGNTTAVSFAEPWNLAPAVFIQALSGSSANATGSYAVNGVTTTGFNIYNVNNPGAQTVIWFAVRMPNLGL